MVAWVAGAAGPVVLAPCQWEPDGLGWRLPSRRACASRRRHYCLGGCSALLVCARRSGLVRGDRAGALSCLPPPCLSIPPSHPCRCVWCVAPSSCPSSLPADTPFLVVCAFREVTPVVILVRAAYALCVRVLTLPRCSPPPPLLPVSRTHFACSPRRAPLGPFQVVRAPPHFLLGSLAPPVSVGGGGWARSPRRPAWFSVVCPECCLRHDGDGADGRVSPGAPAVTHDVWGIY